MTDTIQYWTDKAYEALSEASKISEATGVGFGFSLGNTELTYMPEHNGHVTKERALDLLASGRVLSEIEKAAIREAIEEETILDESDWSSSNTGWVTSSDLC